MALAVVRNFGCAIVECWVVVRGASQAVLVRVERKAVQQV